MRELPLTKNIDLNRGPLSLKEYEQAGGYSAFRKALKMAPADITALVQQAGLRGRGGAGCNTGLKWSFIPKENDGAHRYIIVNADEMEPGTFKDRLLLEGDPHLMLEGMMIAAHAIGADIGYVFLRWAYKTAAKIFEKAIAEAEQAGYLGKNILGTGFNLHMHLHTGVGRYMCGEETALLNSLEGKRATPRAKPPFPQVSGLFGRPTIVNNVETFCCVPSIVNNGADWFKSLSLTAEGGTKLYGVSGKVKKPGLWELPMGVTLRELIYDHAGGMQEGTSFKGALPGGASTDFMVEEHLDVKMDFAGVESTGSRLGTGTIVVLDEKTCPVGFVHNLQHFFAQESCGFCTPCREGLPWVEKILMSIEEGNGSEEDIDLLHMHTHFLAPGKTFCALAPGAMEPLQSALKYFGD